MLSKRHLAIWPIGALLLALLPIGVAQAGPRIDERFQSYYRQHEGLRVLGNPISNLVEYGGYPAQYFEKGRLEDHRAESIEPDWQFMYGRLTTELVERELGQSASGTNLTYADLARYADPAYRHPAPRGFEGDSAPSGDGTFVPFDAQLQPAPGYIVAPYFWAYINRADLFPGGWLHDVGLPITDVLAAKAAKAGEQRTIFLQAFERTILTYDLHNPAGWQVERGNVGSDALGTLPGIPAGPIEIPAADSDATMPLHLLARVGQPGDQITAHLCWQQGCEQSQALEVIAGEDGRGLVIGTLGWNDSAWQIPATQAATLDLRDARGKLLARQRLRVLSYDDPDVQEITLYWTAGNNVWPMLQHIPKATQLGAAAIDALLWGPPPNLAGYGTALPTPDEVLSAPNRELDWGPRVTLRRLTVVKGLATADFSPELWAYSADTARVTLAHQQIAHTLKQFAGVQQVRIQIDGQTVAVVGE
jgi:hypothetical protein